MNWIVWLAPKSAGRPSRYRAPRMAPGMEPRPPITTMEMITNEVVGSKVMSVLLSCWVAKAKHTPA